MTHDRQRGVTLIELLVGLSIVAFASSIVVLTAPPRKGPAKKAAESLAARLHLTTEESILTGRRARMTVDDTGYVIEQLKDRQWSPVHRWAMGEDRDVVGFEIIGDAPARDNSLALNAGAETVTFLNQTPSAGQAAQGGVLADKEVRRYPLDPLGGGEAFTARFAGRREVWIVQLDDVGVISVGRE